MLHQIVDVLVVDHRESADIARIGVDGDVVAVAMAQKLSQDLHPVPVGHGLVGTVGLGVAEGEDTGRGGRAQTQVGGQLGKCGAEALQGEGHLGGALGAGIGVHLEVVRAGGRPLVQVGGLRRGDCRHQQEQGTAGARGG